MTRALLPLLAALALTNLGFWLLWPFLLVRAEAAGWSPAAAGALAAGYAIAARTGAAMAVPSDRISTGVVMAIFAPPAPPPPSPKGHRPPRRRAPVPAPALRPP